MTTTSHETAKGRGHHDHHHDDHECHHTVSIHVNNNEVFLQPGRYDVSTFKKVAGVPQADDLDELVDCKLRPVPDDAPMHIQGCEIFISHVREGGSS